MAKRGDNIHKRIDGRWEGRYKNSDRSDGSVRYSSVYASTYSDCKRKLKLAQQDTWKVESTFGENKLFLMFYTLGCTQIKFVAKERQKQNTSGVSLKT